MPPARACRIEEDAPAVQAESVNECPTARAPRFYENENKTVGVPQAALALPFILSKSITSLQPTTKYKTC